MKDMSLSDKPKAFSTTCIDESIKNIIKNKSRPALFLEHVEICLICFVNLCFKDQKHYSKHLKTLIPSLNIHITYTGKYNI